MVGSLAESRNKNIRWLGGSGNTGPLMSEEVMKIKEVV